MKKEKLATYCNMFSPPLSPFSRLFPLFPHFLPVLSPSQPLFSRFSLSSPPQPSVFSSMVGYVLHTSPQVHGWLCLMLSSPHSSIGGRLVLHSRLFSRALISTHPRQSGREHHRSFLSSFKECLVPNLSPARLHNHNPLSIFTHNLIIFQNPAQTTPE